MKTLFFLLFFFLFANFAYSETGTASWYGNESICWQWGGHTRNNELFNENAMTCAMSHTFMLNKWYRVTNIANGKSVIVFANDTGSFAKYGRIIDLSKAAFKKLAPLSKGLIKVSIEEQ